MFDSQMGKTGHLLSASEERSFYSSPLHSANKEKSNTVSEEHSKMLDLKRVH